MLGNPVTSTGDGGVDHDDSKYRRWSRAGLRVARPLVLAVVAAAAFAALLARQHRKFEQELVNRFQQYQLDSAHGTAGAMGEAFDDLVRSFRLIGDREEVRRGGLARLSVLDSYYAARSDVLEYVAVTDADGKLLFQSPRDARLEGRRPLGEFDTIQSGERAHSDKYGPDGLTQGSGCIPVFLPIRKDGVLRGGLLAAVSVQKLLAKCLSRLGVVHGNYYWVIDGDGAVIFGAGPGTAVSGRSANSNVLQFATGSRARRQVASYVVDQCLRARRGGAVEMPIATEGGPQELVAFAPVGLGGYRYGLLVGSPKSAISVPITSHKRVTYTLIVSLALLYFATGYVAYRSESAHARLERTRRRAAEQVSRARGEYLAEMSHEIRTPLTAILGYAELAAEAPRESAERDEAVRVIQRNADHLLSVINDTLDISKMEAGKLVLNAEDFSVVSLIAQTVSMMRVRAHQGGISLTVEHAGELPETILGDQARLSQILVNLVGNAIKFTEEGGVRIVSTFLPNWRGTQPAVRIEVIDTGIGIAGDRLELLREPFVQADVSTPRKYGGTGLGLAIVNHVIDKMGGTLTIDSQPGKGSNFAVTIPTGPLESVAMLHNPAEAYQEEVRQGARPDLAGQVLAGLRILLAEDGPDNQRLIGTILRKAGAEVTLAENGRIAVQRALSDHFDLILMDIQMPEMDGYQATRELRKQGVSVPIIALTAHAMSGHREKCMSAGCTDYVTKPISRHQLIETVMQHTGRQSAGGGQEDQAEQTIQSKFDDDPALAEVIDQFVAGLPGQAKQMRSALANGCFQELRRLGHQLSGAGGSYGYPALSDVGARLEDAAEASDTEGATLAMSELAELTQSVVAGRRGRSPQGAKQ